MFAASRPAVSVDEIQQRLACASALALALCEILHGAASRAAAAPEGLARHVQQAHAAASLCSTTQIIPYT